MHRVKWTCVALVLTAATARAAELPPRPTVADVVKGSKPADWRPLDPANTVYMEVPGGRVVIELAPRFAPQHAPNIRLLARDHYFDGLAVIRSQENYVVQWGDADEKNPRPFKTAKATLPAEFTLPASADTSFVRLPDGDVYAPEVGHSQGFPVARDPKAKLTWLTHCYGMVGVGRDTAADSGGGRRDGRRSRRALSRRLSSVQSVKSLSVGGAYRLVLCRLGVSVATAEYSSSWPWFFFRPPIHLPNRAPAAPPASAFFMNPPPPLGCEPCSRFVMSSRLLT